MAPTIIEQLQAFLKEAEESYHARQWLADDKMKVYVRKGRHAISPGKIATTLDIASVEVDEEYQRQGVWSDFIQKAHELNPWEATYVECVHNPHLAESLLRHGWMPVSQPGLYSPESFFMPKDVAKYYEEQYLRDKIRRGKL